MPMFTESYNLCSWSCSEMFNPFTYLFFVHILYTKLLFVSSYWKKTELNWLVHWYVEFNINWLVCKI
jgi:hypothetical protein